jgi:hypothetical protein
LAQFDKVTTSFHSQFITSWHISSIVIWYI